MRKLVMISIALIASIIAAASSERACCAAFDAYNIDPSALGDSLSSGWTTHKIRYAASDMLRDSGHDKLAELIRPDEFRGSEEDAAAINGMSNAVGDLTKQYFGTTWGVGADTLFSTFFDYMNDPGQDKGELAIKFGQNLAGSVIMEYLSSGSKSGAGPYAQSQVLPNMLKGAINYFGKAATGTSIGSLNGAAQTLAQNAWVGRIIKPAADLVGYTGTASAIGGTVMNGLSSVSTLLPLLPVVLQGYSEYSRYQGIDAFYRDQRRAISSFEQRLDRFR